MIPNPMGRRRAERFAQLLDEAEGAPRRHIRSVHDEELTELVAVAHTSALQMSAVADQVTVDPAYRRRLRQRLLAVAHTQGIGTTAEHSHDIEPAVAPRRRRAKLAVAAGAAAGVLALSGVSSASGEAIPGDALYPVKRQTERAQLALAGSEVNKGQLYLGFARTRLREAQAVADDPNALRSALDDMDTDLRSGVRLLTGAAVARRDPEVLTTVDTFVTDQRRKVVDLVTGLQGESRGRALASLELLDKAADRSAGLRQSLLCTSDAGGYADSLGPVPQHCTAAPDPGNPAAGTTGSGGTSNDPGTSGSPSRGATRPGDPSPSGLLPINPRTGAANPSPSKSPSSGILDELGKIIGDLLDG